MAQANAASSQANAAASQANAATAQADAANAQSALAANQAISAAAVTAAQTDADQSRLVAQHALEGQQKADSEKVAMRAQLSEQLNKILATRDSARGLIVSMSDVLFDTGQIFAKAWRSREAGEGRWNTDRLSRAQHCGWRIHRQCRRR